MFECVNVCAYSVCMFIFVCVWRGLGVLDVFMMSLCVCMSCLKTLSVWYVWMCECVCMYMCVSVCSWCVYDVSLSVYVMFERAVCVSERVYVCVNVCAYSACMFVCVCMHVFAFFVSVSVCPSIHIYIYKTDIYICIYHIYVHMRVSVYIFLTTGQELKSWA